MNKVLVVVDMQNDFISGVLGTKEAIEIVPKVVDKIKNFEGTVVFTQDSHDNNYLETQEGKYLPAEHCIIDSEGCRICKELFKYQSKNRIYRKNTFGSRFLAVDLYEQNTYEEIDEIELVGLCTGICVISNALLIKSFLPETKITVDANCCACVTPDSHIIAIEAMKMCQINIINE